MVDKSKAVGGEIPCMPDKTTQKRLDEEEVLRKMGYEWSNDYQVWASQIDYSLPVLKNLEAHELVKCFNKYVKGEDK
ncbi:hypothetical protein [Liquorilactobacillus hordei]|uniref:hypothetical protein n=1 Tax=Liquorilactobacillus hordei TaxID=468911 RepID=UPI0039E999DC